MAKQYKWKADTGYNSDTVLSWGVEPEPHTGWRAQEAGTYSGEWGYWFRDANWGPPFSDDNSSRVIISVAESWTASIDNRNYLTVTIRSTINHVKRDKLSGSNPSSPGREMFIYREKGGSALLRLIDSDISTEHTIWEGPLILDDYTFTLPPGENLQRPSLYLHNHTIPADQFPSYDDIDFGVTFLNDLPKDYRPGASLNTSTGVWKSHNRTNGACHVLKNGIWQECRTLDGAEGGKGNPPLILTAANANSWRNQKRLGKE